MAHTGLHNHMRALDVKRVSSALCHQAEAALPGWEGLAQWGPLETGRKPCMAAVVSTWMATVCCCWSMITALMPIACLGKQTKSVRELTCGPGENHNTLNKQGNCFQERQQCSSYICLSCQERQFPDWGGHKIKSISTSLCFPHLRRSLSPILCSHKGKSKWILLLGERWTTLLKYKYLPQQMEDGEVDLSSLGWKSQTLAEMTSIEQGDLSYSSINSLSIALESKPKKPCVWTKPV